MNGTTSKSSRSASALRSIRSFARRNVDWLRATRSAVLSLSILGLCAEKPAAKPVQAARPAPRADAGRPPSVLGVARLPQPRDPLGEQRVDHAVLVVLLLDGGVRGERVQRGPRRRLGQAELLEHAALER